MPTNSGMMGDQQPVVSEREFRIGRQLAATQVELNELRGASSKLLTALNQSTKLRPDDLKGEREFLRRALEIRPTQQPL